MMKKYKTQAIFKFLITKLFFLLILLNQIAYSKPLPPGSGAGDVKANILILLDSSKSMSNKPMGGDSVEQIGDIVLLSDGDIIVGQSKANAAVVKYDYSTEKLDTDFAGGAVTFWGTKLDSCSSETDLQDSRIANVTAMDITSDLLGNGGNEVIYIAAQNLSKVVGIDSDGECVEVITDAELGRTNYGTNTGLFVEGLTIRTIDSEDHMIVNGREFWCTKTKGKGKKKKCQRWSQRSVLYSRNLTTGASKLCDVNSRYTQLVQHSQSPTMDNGSNLYFSYSGYIYKIPISKSDGTYCFSGSSLTTFGAKNNSINSPTQIEIDPQDDSIMYVTSLSESTLQKISISTSSLTESISVGGNAEIDATPSSAATDSDDINMHRPSALFVSNNRVWTGGTKISIQEFDISSSSITWVDEMGSSKLTRLQGAINAIKATVQDSSLQHSANFGYGYWNAGIEIPKRRGKAKFLWCPTCEYSCHNQCPKKKSFHRCNVNCEYFGSWKGQHPFGQSSICNDNSCLAVGIASGNTQRIVNQLDHTTMRFGTDARAFADLAYKYFNDSNVNVVDTTSDCQINYVIVIGDGKWHHHDDAAKDIRNLRTELGVKTIVVAYGGGINATGLKNFDKMAIEGSCGDPTGEDSECMETVVANTPADLLTKLKSEVERIIASKLSFTAPSITATIEGTGDLYQAQFEYAQHGQWEGSLVRKKIGFDKTITHEIGEEGNWDAADIVKNQADSDSRNIWTTIPGEKNYIDQKWNNFVTDNSGEINKLFQILGDKVPDYHNTSSTCKDEDGVEAGNSDDIDGLINFVRGKDYFAYSGCSGLGEVRNHVLGDIYHSQVIEVGPPSARTDYTSNHQESFWRVMNNYASFASTHANRERVLYAGGNDGMLHAFRATSSGTDDSGSGAGEELWGFVPPFIAGKLPSLVNEALDGAIDGKGGTNSIFAVDGSPVVHDMYFQGLNRDGTYQGADEKSWHTVLFVPYGRGGQGFSVLDVTYPLEPLHMFSIFNDTVNGVVLVADKDGNIDPHFYEDDSFHISDSLEAVKAEFNQQVAYDADIATDSTGDTYTEQDNIATCQDNDDASSGSFRIDGTNACYKGTSFTFKFKASEEIQDNPKRLRITSRVEGKVTTLEAKTVSTDGELTTVTFDSEKVYNASRSDLGDADPTPFRIVLASSGPSDVSYNYSKLGETWAAPRIIRLPSDEDYRNDVYVAVLAGGYGASDEIGSAVFLVNLETIKEKPGAIEGAEVNNGPITIINLNTEKKDSEGNVIADDIPNSIPTDPVIITPDRFKGANWRGALVYINDFEGKITKINLTSMVDNGAAYPNTQPVELYDQTTLFRLGATYENGRLSYFGMDAAYGSQTKNLWLFGGTGDFGDIGAKSKGMDNILYGIRDYHFPYFEHSPNQDGASIIIPTGNDSLFYSTAEEVALGSPMVDESDHCADTSKDDLVGDCPGETKDAWIFKLDKPNDKSGDLGVGAPNTQNKYRKVSASPTVFRGTVYYPVYTPPEGDAVCGVGNAYICSADDECGINNSEKIQYTSKSVRAESRFDTESGCYYLQPGILSKLVVFGETLFANITTSSDDQKDTLVSILSGDSEIFSQRGAWRENY